MGPVLCHIIAHNKTLQVLVPDIPDETSAGFVLSLDRIVLYRSLQLLTARKANQALGAILSFSIS